MVPFVNSYRASTDNPGGELAQIVATKTLTGRPLADGEFYFGIAYAARRKPSRVRALPTLTAR